MKNWNKTEDRALRNLKQVRKNVVGREEERGGREGKTGRKRKHTYSAPPISDFFILSLSLSPPDISPASLFPSVPLLPLSSPLFRFGWMTHKRKTEKERRVTAGGVGVATNRWSD